MLRVFTEETSKHGVAGPIANVYYTKDKEHVSTRRKQFWGCIYMKNIISKIFLDN
jgi:hypothetical protein